MLNLITQDIYQESSVQQHNLGTLGMDKFGNKYRYVKNGAAALAAGHLLQEPAEDTNYYSMVCAASAAIGAKEVSITLGGTAVTANQFLEGDLVIESGTGLGQLRKIVRHDVQTSTTGTLVVEIDRPLETAIVITTSQVSIRKNAYHGVVDFPTTPTGAPVGVALYKMTAAYYGWVQSGGNCAVLYDTGVNIAADAMGIMPSAAVAGSVSPSAAADVSPSYIGYSRAVVSVDSTFGFAFLTID